MVDDMTVKFEIWDTAGQERYHSLAPMYYRGAQAAIVVYDVTSHDSFVRAKQWIRELQRQANPGIIIALAGNKVDLAARRMVEYNVSNPLILPFNPFSVFVISLSIFCGGNIKLNASVSVV